jgi:phosphatidylinositol-3-phosphatase
MQHPLGTLLRCAVIAGLLLLAANGLYTPPAEGAAHGPSPTTEASPWVAAPSFPTPIRHVITVLLENQDGGTVSAWGPFEHHLDLTYASAPNYYAVCHPSAPNYLALTSGASWQCGSDVYHVYSTANIADLVDAAGLTWGAYMEDMPRPCDTNNTGLYAVRHDPFVFYQDIVGNSTRCETHVQDFSAWDEAVATGNVPN